MNQANHQHQAHPPGFTAFVVLLGGVIGVSACAPRLQGCSTLQIWISLALVLIFASLTLWLLLRSRLRAQHASYASAYRCRLRKKMHFQLHPDGTLTDQNGKPLPRPARETLPATSAGATQDRPASRHPIDLPPADS